MPFIFRVICERCKHTEEIMDDQELFDGTSFVPLCHPGESKEMERLGHPKTEALAEGRVFWWSYCVCTDCKSVVTRRALRRPEWQGYRVGRSGTLAMWISAIPIAVIAAVRGWPVYVYMPLIVLIWLLLSWIVTARDTRRAKRKAAEHEKTARASGERHESGTCSSCGGRNLADYVSYVHQQRTTSGENPPLRCPACHELTMRDDPTCMMMA